MSTKQQLPEDVAAARLPSTAADAKTVVDHDRHVPALTAALTEHRLTVTCDREVMVVRNPATFESNDPLGALLNPGLSQRILLQHTDHGPYWCWLWDPPRDVDPPPPPEIEPICPAGDIDEAARRISNVLHINAPNATPI